MRISGGEWSGVPESTPARLCVFSEQDKCRTQIFVKNLSQIRSHVLFSLVAGVCVISISDEPESFLSSQSRVTVTNPSSQSRVRIIWNFVESESSHDLVESSHKNGRFTSSYWFTSSSQCRVIQISNFSYIFLAIGPPVDLQWLQVRQWIFSSYRSASRLSI